MSPWNQKDVRYLLKLGSILNNKVHLNNGKYAKYPTIYLVVLDLLPESENSIFSFRDIIEDIKMKFTDIESSDKI